VTVLVVAERGFNRVVLVGMESDSLSVDGDRAERKRSMDGESCGWTNLNVYHVLVDVE
jgi:hypothetical protein